MESHRHHRGFTAGVGAAWCVLLALFLVVVGAGSSPQPAAAASARTAAAPQYPKPEITDRQWEAADGFAGPDGEVKRANLLVDRADGEFEWTVLCVARKADGSTALVDTDGRVYEGGIDDFRENNELFTSEDEITFSSLLLSDDPGDDPGEDAELVTRSGHTENNWVPWFVVCGAVVVAVLAGGTLLLLRRPRGIFDRKTDDLA